MKKIALMVFVFLVAKTLAVQAACPSPPPAGLIARFALSADGLEVTDNRTRLVWARCSVGQSWSGSACVGAVSPMDHRAALGLGAQGQYSGWRLPSVKELVSLADNGCPTPSIDGAAFPNTPSTHGYWASTPNVGNSDFAYSVLFQDGFGQVASYNRFTGFAVRLVRTAP